MKKIVLILTLFLTSFYGFSQTAKPIEGFLGIKFGSSKADVIAAIKAKGGTLLNNSNEDELQFGNISLGHRAAIQLSVVFVNNKTYLANFFLKAENDPQTVDYYDGLVKDINDVYGQGKPYKDFKSPYKDGDGDEIIALKGGYATIFTTWKSDKNTVQVRINSKLYVVLLYEDGTLSAEAEAKKKEKQKADF